jgi:ABC-type transport system involved in multi-copper enzyme maturation permease subunit
MKPIVLIAGNFVREQRWPIVVLLAWILLLAIVHRLAELSRTKEDLLFLFQQVATYVLVFTVFFGISAIRNERRSRRILPVLAKGIRRSQYIAGLLMGMLLASAIFCVALLFAGVGILGAFGYAPGQVIYLLSALLIACLLTGAVTLFFSVFLHPLVAAGATFALLGLPVALVRWFGPEWRYAMPVYPLLNSFYHLSVPELRLPGWDLLIVGVLESVAMWVLASWTFSSKDITVALE